MWVTGYVEIVANGSDSDVLSLLRPGLTSAVNLGAAAPRVILNFNSPFQLFSNCWNPLSALVLLNKKNTMFSN